MECTNQSRWSPGTARYCTIEGTVVKVTSQWLLHGNPSGFAYGNGICYNHHVAKTYDIGGTISDLTSCGQFPFHLYVCFMRLSVFHLCSWSRFYIFYIQSYYWIIFNLCSSLPHFSVWCSVNLRSLFHLQLPAPKSARCHEEPNRVAPWQC